MKHKKGRPAAAAGHAAGHAAGRAGRASGGFFTPNALDLVQFTLLNPTASSAAAAASPNGSLWAHESKKHSQAPGAAAALAPRTAAAASDRPRSGGPSSQKLDRSSLYARRHSILLVGEGDFSFAAALVTSLLGLNHRDPEPPAPPTRLNIIATSLDRRSDLSFKYGKAGVARRLLDLATRVTLRHGVDATTMASADPVVAANAPYDRIVFNFPHVGGSTPSDVAENQRVLRRFFRQCRRLVVARPDKDKDDDDDDERPGRPHPYLSGQVHVALRQTPFYRAFDLDAQAAAAGFRLAVPPAPFAADDWMALGFRPQRTHPAVREAPSIDGALLYVFELDPAAVDGDHSDASGSGSDDEDDNGGSGDEDDDMGDDDEDDDDESDTGRHRNRENSVASKRAKWGRAGRKQPESPAAASAKQTLRKPHRPAGVAKRSESSRSGGGLTRGARGGKSGVRNPPEKKRKVDLPPKRFKKIRRKKR
ncbi:hypothetical protein DFJ73DRAFT_797233 [Zopfochytrium polystomum]|nr:hypothetical protein DFJ73DRAFT_797233 [Zopfochytrium polystomum]